VRLNPQLMAECPLAISIYCSEVPGGARLRRAACLEQASSSPPAATSLGRLASWRLGWRLGRVAHRAAARSLPGHPALQAGWRSWLHQSPRPHPHPHPTPTPPHPATPCVPEPSGAPPPASPPNPRTGDAQLVQCLRSHMGDEDFPADCKEVLTSQISRSSYKYSLNPALKKACDEGGRRSATTGHWPPLSPRCPACCAATGPCPNTLALQTRQTPAPGPPAPHPRPPLQTRPPCAPSRTRRTGSATCSSAWPPRPAASTGSAAARSPAWCACTSRSTAWACRSPSCATATCSPGGRR
jgi:hypothetical protein